jgi:hypothetical protein
MTEEQKVARREYKRRWRQANPDRCREYQVRFWTKKAEEIKAAETNDNQDK